MTRATHACGGPSDQNTPHFAIVAAAQRCDAQLTYTVAVEGVTNTAMKSALPNVTAFNSLRFSPFAEHLVA